MMSDKDVHVWRDLYSTSFEKSNVLHHWYGATESSILLDSLSIRDIAKL